MRYLLLILVFLGFCSCRQNEILDKYKQTLPDSVLINDIIERVIELDSFNTNHGINKKVFRIKVVKTERLENKSIIIPPPPDGISYDELLKNFESKNLSEWRKKDSIFISLQSDTTRRFVLSAEICSKFNKESVNQFRFYMPIFSRDKKYVYIKYLSGYRLEPSRHEIVLKWTNGKWLKKESW